tara:strand:- start:3343 stop:3519 length:177 start_codon:yes stop_codon:yes gene_type:complete
MKKYILTIVYDEKSDNVEWMQEEIEEVECLTELTQEIISQLTCEDMEILMESKEYGKA